MKRLTRFGVVAANALVASSCATPPVSHPGSAEGQAPVAQRPAVAPQEVPRRRLQTVVECPDAGTVVPKPGISPAPFEQVDKLPTGSSFHLDFKVRPSTGKGQVPAADKLYFVDDVPFDLKFVEGPAFKVIDSDGSDGEVVVAVPDGYYDAYFGATGKPGGTLTVGEPMFFQQQTQTVAAGQDS